MTVYLNIPLLMVFYIITMFAVPMVQVEIWKKVNREKLERDLRQVYNKGIRSLAVVLMHAYT